MPHEDGKWFIAGREGIEIRGTRGKSKDKATGRFCEQMDMLNGVHHDWVHWNKRGYKLRKE